MLSLSECLGRVQGTPAPSGKLEALDLWLSERRDAALCVGAVGLERRCSVRVHGQTFQAVGHGGGWQATWTAIVEAILVAEGFERASGYDVG